jgi:hypothetical protein
MPLLKGTVRKSFVNLFVIFCVFVGFGETVLGQTYNSLPHPPLPPTGSRYQDKGWVHNTNIWRLFFALVDESRGCVGVGLLL